MTESLASTPAGTDATRATGTLPTAPPPAAADSSANPRKRQRVEEDPDAAAPHKDSNSSDAEALQLGHSTPDELPVAMRVVRALQYAYRLDAIGHCPTRHSARTAELTRGRPDLAATTYDQTVVPDPDAYDVSEEERAKAIEVADRFTRDNERFRQLASIAKESGRGYASGYLAQPFKLRILRPGCEFDGTVSPTRTDFKSEWECDRNVEDKAAREELHMRLQQWYDNALTSGYGDVLEQVTKIDDTVRTARELGPSEFVVDSALLRAIENIWTERFVPSSDVRAKPYKIHLYGPGGHFKMHRDTPHKDLAGTFLVGLGDTARSGGLVVDGTEMEAQPGSWCAFYPDVPHYVQELSHGYRAVIAFKIYHTHASEGSRGSGETKKTAETRLRVAEVIAGVEAPYGVLLEHKYSLGTSQFRGFDALLADAVKAQSLGRFDVHSLPVVVQTRSEWGWIPDDYDNNDEYVVRSSTLVYPFTSSHIDCLNTVRSGYGAKPALCGCAWLEGVKSVPFYSVDVSHRTLVPYKEDEQETINHTGNEAEAWREDSVYLSYALLVLPKPEGTTGTDGVQSLA